jgi:hypothetical protein
VFPINHINKDKIMSVTYDSHFNGYPIQTNKENGRGCYVDILQKLHNQMEYMTTTHSKVLQVRVDVRYPQDYASEPQQKDFSRFCKNFKRNLEYNSPVPQEGRKRGRRPKDADGQPITPKHRVDPSILLVPEQHGEDRHPHGHVVIQVNGNAKRNPIDIFKRAEREWGTAIGEKNPKGLVHYCNTNGSAHHLIDRNRDFEADVAAAFYHSSYQAKIEGKEYRAKGAWKVIGTRTPKTKKTGD